MSPASRIFPGLFSDLTDVVPGSGRQLAAQQIGFQPAGGFRDLLHVSDDHRVPNLLRPVEMGPHVFGPLRGLAGLLRSLCSGRRPFRAAGQNAGAERHNQYPSTSCALPCQPQLPILVEFEDIPGFPGTITPASGPWHLNAGHTLPSIYYLGSGRASVETRSGCSRAESKRVVPAGGPCIPRHRYFFFRRSCSCLRFFRPILRRPDFFSFGRLRAIFLDVLPV